MGKTNVNIASLSFQLPLSVIPSLPIVVVPKSDTIIISLNGFPFETPTWYWSVTDWPNTSYFPILKVSSADIEPNCPNLLILFVTKS